MRHIVGWLLGLFGLTLFLLTVLHLISTLSTESGGLVNDNVPSLPCGGYVIYFCIMLTAMSLLFLCVQIVSG